MAVSVPGFRRHTVSGLPVASGAEGPPVLLLHDFPQTHPAWRHVVPVLDLWASLRGADPARRPRRLPGGLPHPRGHFLPESQPEAVARAIGALIRWRGPGTSRGGPVYGGRRCVMKRILALVVAVLAFAWWEAPVSASVLGGWAVTYLDPPPEEFAGGKAYTVGFWVLQHGTHPYVGKLDPVGLRLTRGDGKVLTFDGTALPEAGHYATSVVVPDGVWKVEGVQGWFAPYELGTLTVPGRLLVNPVPPEMVATLGGDGKDPWGAVRPPGFPPGKSTPVQLVGDSAVGGGSAVGAPGGWVPGYTLVLAAVGGALVVLAAMRLPRPWRASRRTNRKAADPGPPAQDGPGETLVIGG
ncbi:hypothetical protein DMB42_32120 [Nonomuraea sp. WAC 01424]|uniref:hypothetical protein n=1 Tax=Nonomuraea sp. WAC 01424 TaxID=2203200 RepID=UPI000F794932|nr:hypothetical protein [Nonomuraea sp. WAC 01424]RSN04313.1 hypothetical protein DMB42_32120 [Nonomuraea sp. WAC 01424]